MELELDQFKKDSSHPGIVRYWIKAVSLQS